MIRNIRHTPRLGWFRFPIRQDCGNKLQATRIQYFVGNVEKLCEPFHVAVVLTLQNSDKAIHAAH